MMRLPYSVVHESSDIVQFSIFGSLISDWFSRLVIKMKKYKKNLLIHILISSPPNVVLNIFCFLVDVFNCNSNFRPNVFLNYLQNPICCSKSNWTFFIPSLRSLVWLLLSNVFNGVLNISSRVSLILTKYVDRSWLLGVKNLVIVELGPAYLFWSISVLCEVDNPACWICKQKQY